MSDIKIQPSATGSATVTLTAPVSNTARTITLPDSTSTLLASDGSGASLTNLPAQLTGITDNSNATAITIDSSEKINIHQGRLQLGHVNKFIDTTNYVGDMINIAYHPYSAGINLGQSYPADSPTTVVKGIEIANTHLKFYLIGTGGSPTEKVRIDTDGLKFHGDTAAANALDDYEEGNWTPVFTGTSGSAGSFNVGEWNGRYTKIGRMVTCVFTTTLSNKGSWGGEVRITGLPFTPIITMPCSGSLRLAYVNFAGGSVGGLSCHITSGQTYIRCIYSQDNDVSTVVQVSECSNTSVFSGEFTFMIA